EGQIAEGLGAIQACHPALDIGSYPYYRPDRSGVALVAKGLEEAEVVAAAAEMAALIRQVGKEPLEGEPG
ncbi:competence/damage-inducible protein A, partial [Roseomonas sp. DSM 102946]|nr:competence/damage-inducible protein A [Roseomonas sp. DSM 102946]